MPSLTETIYMHELVFPEAQLKQPFLERLILSFLLGTGTQDRKPGTYNRNNRRGGTASLLARTCVKRNVESVHVLRVFLCIFYIKEGI